MRIIRIYKRVGNKSDVYKFRATIDTEKNVTKESYDFQENGDVSFRDRIKTDLFTYEQLEKASNFNLFKEDIHNLSKDWTKKQVKMTITTSYESGKNIFLLLKNGISHIRKLVTSAF